MPCVDQQSSSMPQSSSMSSKSSSSAAAGGGGAATGGGAVTCHKPMIRSCKYQIKWQEIHMKSGTRFSRKAACVIVNSKASVANYQKMLVIINEGTWQVLLKGWGS